jgi:hypothetical protein
MMTLVLLFLATCFLAYSNGANDNFKGVAAHRRIKLASLSRLGWSRRNVSSDGLRVLVVALG